MFNTDKLKQLNHLVWIGKVKSKQIFIHIFYSLMSKYFRNNVKMTVNLLEMTIMQYYLTFSALNKRLLKRYLFCIQNKSAGLIQSDLGVKFFSFPIIVQIFFTANLNLIF